MPLAKWRKKSTWLRMNQWNSFKHFFLTIVYCNYLKHGLFFSECYNFTSLTDADRKSSFRLVEPAKNDTNLGPGWFRFQGDAGSMMTTLCPPKEKCNTAATGWLNGTHPEVTDGIVTRQVCFSYNAGCCEWQTQIQVRNCNEYIVYYLHSTPFHGGSLRYCGTD